VSIPPSRAAGENSAASRTPWEWLARRRIWLFGIALIVATLVIYQPAWNGGLVWDDEAHVTKPELRSPEGLRRIWFDLHATQQYYPLMHSAFWLQWHLWGDSTLGYHLVNIILHAIAAVMVCLILRRLEVPGAYLAAAIFAFHPVHVESVAWITELKNTLSGVFYLGAAMAYLRFDQTRRKGPYALAAVLFVLGLLSKTVTATLPAALLVIFWWKRGRLTLKRDVLPLLPLFALGAAGGLFTAWVERNLIGAEGAAFDFTAIQRCLIAGRVVWFYLGKLFWPADLTFIYPRWNVRQDVWWQYLYPIAALMLLVTLWLLRRRTRAPLAAMLFFVGTLFPVLGFFNVFPFRYSYVADHFQYLPSLAVISFCAGGLVWGLRRFRRWARPAVWTAGTVVLVALAIPSWRQSAMYTDIEGLYRQTLAGNPDCWMAHNNLASKLTLRGKLDEAVEHYREAIRLVPAWAGPFPYNNLGAVLLALGRYGEAIEALRQALSINPYYAPAHSNLGVAFLKQRKHAAAIEHLEEALRINPKYAEAHYNMGLVLMAQNKPDEAIYHYRQALNIRPDHAEVHYNLANVLAMRDEFEAACEHYRQALRIAPNHFQAHTNLGYVLVLQNKLDEAVAHLEKALRIAPNHADAHANMGLALDRQRKLDEAVAHYLQAVKASPDSIQLRHSVSLALIRQGKNGEAMEHLRHILRLNSDDADACNSLAWLLATGQSPAKEDLAQAVELSERACRLTPKERWDYVDTLAAAYAAAGRFREAVAAAQKAIELAEASRQTRPAEEIRKRLELYRSGKVYREQ
jgi:tetratricopeptide (TPR) repeat protein